MTASTEGHLKFSCTYAMCCGMLAWAPFNAFQSSRQNAESQGVNSLVALLTVLSSITSVLACLWRIESIGATPLTLTMTGPSSFLALLLLVLLFALLVLFVSLLALMSLDANTHFEYNECKDEGFVCNVRPRNI